MTFLPFLLPLAALLALPVAWRGLTHPETPMLEVIRLCAVVFTGGALFGLGLGLLIADRLRPPARPVPPPVYPRADHPAAKPTRLYDHQEAGL